jgi:hypothetical protein
MKKPYIIIVLIILALIIFFLVSRKAISREQNQPTGKKTEATKNNTISETITHSASKKEKYDNIEFSEGQTALDILQKSTEIKTDGTGAMAFVTEISQDKAEKDKKEFWAFYINGKSSTVGAGGYTLQLGDNIEWKKENY